MDTEDKVKVLEAFMHQDMNMIKIADFKKKVRVSLLAHNARGARDYDLLKKKRDEELRKRKVDLRNPNLPKFYKIHSAFHAKPPP